jgi:farnesol dehydrogenase
VRDLAALRNAASGCDAVCHSAALVAIWRRRRDEFDAVNIGGLRHALAAAAEHRIPRIVYTSSFLALPPSDLGGLRPGVAGNDYLRTKAAAERVAADAVADGAPLIRLYPGVVYGPGDQTEGNLVGRLVRDHLRGRLPGVVGGDRVWSFAYVTDVAEAHVKALEAAQPQPTYALGGENLPQMRLFEIVRDFTGRRLPRRIPERLARILGVLEELRGSVTGATPLLTRGTVDVLCHDWPLDSTSAIRDLNYRITPLADGLTAVLKHHAGH